MSDSLSIAACPANQRADALRVLHDDLPADQQAGLVYAVNATQRLGDGAFDGLFVATSLQGIVGAAWAQLTAGNTAVIWPPKLTNRTGVQLMKALAGFLSERSISLAQFLMSPATEISREILEAGELQKLARLAYLSVDCQSVAGQRPESCLTFRPSANDDPDRLGELLRRTYVGSQDCPQLDSVRNVADVITGYQAQGTYQPDRWFIVQQEDRDVGALILTVHEETGHWELVYMGLVPEVRGKGWGGDVLQFGMWQAKRGGAERLVLAVDEANQPALDMYEQAGFVAWDYRTVDARIEPRK